MAAGSIERGETARQIGSTSHDRGADFLTGRGCEAVDDFILWWTMSVPYMLNWCGVVIKLGTSKTKFETN